jgi:hypothetical protein
MFFVSSFHADAPVYQESLLKSVFGLAFAVVRTCCSFETTGAHHCRSKTVRASLANAPKVL